MKDMACLVVVPGVAVIGCELLIGLGGEPDVLVLVFRSAGPPGSYLQPLQAVGIVMLPVAVDSDIAVFEAFEDYKAAVWPVLRPVTEEADRRPGQIQEPAPGAAGQNEHVGRHRTQVCRRTTIIVAQAFQVEVQVSGDVGPAEIDRAGRVQRDVPGDGEPFRDQCATATALILLDGEPAADPGIHQAYGAPAGEAVIEGQ